MDSQERGPLVFTMRSNPALHRRLTAQTESRSVGSTEPQGSTIDTANIRVHLSQNSDPGGEQKLHEERHDVQRYALTTQHAIPENGQLPTVLMDTIKTNTTKLNTWPIWPLTTRYRCYDVTTFDTTPSVVELSNIVSYSGEKLFQDQLYLFNVLVAIEWVPSRGTLQQLIAAFQNASDFLYDATDGYMAFGQVVFGGMELMAGADIQILASNRFHPRSWVNALNDQAKYMPIRLGRAIWHKNNHVSIPWNEPEGYRSIIHEWGHYALGLLDEYIDEPSKRQDTSLTPDRPNLVIPKLSISSESIMATLDGTSEIVPQQRRHNAEMASALKARLEQYPGVDFTGPVNEGPYRLPIELPTFSTINSSFGDDQQAEELRINVDDIELDHCWVYLLRGGPENPSIIAQGSFDARSQPDRDADLPGEGFLLYGVHQGDTLLFIGNDKKSKQLVVQHRSIDTTSEADNTYITALIAYATPGSIPVVTVVPKPIAKIGDNTPLLTDIHARIAGPLPPDDVWFCPLGQVDSVKVQQLTPSGAGIWISNPIPVMHLDGQVLLRWNANPEKGILTTQYMIYDYSQGGGPNSHVKAPDPPITAGSSDGNVMFFFRSDIPKSNDKAPPPNAKTLFKGLDNEAIHVEYSKIRIVTTRNYAGLDDNNPGQPRSYLFSAAWNQPIPADELCPTLVMNFDRDALAADDKKSDGTLIINRYSEKLTRWIATNTYIPKGAFFAAVELKQESDDPDLAFDPNVATDTIAHYRLFLRLNDASKTEN